MNTFIRLENGDLLNLSQVVRVSRIRKKYWVETIEPTYSYSISESDFNKIKNMSI